MFSWPFSQMNVDDYLHCSLSVDGSLHSMGQHRPGFPRVLWDALIRLGYHWPIPFYHCRPFQAHGFNVCKVRVEIPFDPMMPWMGAIIGSEIDDAVEKMAHTDLTSLCEHSLNTTADMPFSLFPIHDQEDPVWQQRLEAMSNLKSPHFDTGWAVMPKYARYLFILQHSTGRTVI
jgi:hypothetical protein